ncbi:MAG: hypothetical protein HZB37_09945 [Planctomycetes bacterium]|nr:hypothetical protein [Planctomycetota bacterium]
MEQSNGRKKYLPGKHVGIMNGIQIKPGIQITTRALSFITIFAFLLFGCGCAYRGDAKFQAGYVPEKATTMLITREDITNRKYEPLGTIEATVKKLTIFNANPTEEQVNIKLEEKAAEIGADAVIRVNYSFGVGLWSWGEITARGIAIRF